MLGFRSAAQVITPDWEWCTDSVSLHSPSVFCLSLFLSPPLSHRKVWHWGQLAEDALKPTTAYSIFSHTHTRCSLYNWVSCEVSYLVLGFTQLVLQFREAEASHGDEVTDHSHKLIPTFPCPALLVVQLLEEGKTDERRVIFKEKTG